MQHLERREFVFIDDLVVAEHFFGAAFRSIKMLYRPMHKDAFERLRLGQTDCAKLMRVLQGKQCRAQQRRMRQVRMVIGNAFKQEADRCLNNRAENAYLPLRRRELAMLRFRQMRSLQKFVAVHSSVHNHFNQERHLHSRTNFKLNRAAALGVWRNLGAA
jgi:hypothetical protein